MESTRRPGPPTSRAVGRSRVGDSVTEPPRVSVRLAIQLVAALAVMWMAWPADLGGQTTYVVTHGTSMEPSFHTGDLAVVRPADHYRVGDIAAYHSQVLHTVVMHRIVAIHHGRYTFQGDNNGWLDPETPSRNQLIGTVRLHIPRAGRWLDAAASAPALGAAAFLLAIAGGGVVQPRRTRRRTRMSRHTARRHPATLGSLSPSLRPAALAAAVAGLAGLGLAAAAWTGPTRVGTETSRAISRTMSFSYSASVPRSPAYDTTTVVSPAPVFRALTNTVDVTYAYHGPAGRVAVQATVSATNGWRTSIRLGTPRSFTSDHYRGVVRLQLNRLQARADAAAAVIGLPSDQLTVLVSATVDTGSGAPFAASMPLTLTPQQLTTNAGRRQVTVSDATGAGRAGVAPRLLSAAGRTIPVTTARVISGVLLILALATAGLIAWSARRSAQGTEASLIRRRYGPMLVGAEPVDTPPGHVCVDVSDFETLVRVADRYGLFILHWTRANLDTYLVRDDATSYRYRTSPTPRQAVKS